MTKIKREQTANNLRFSSKIPLCFKSMPTQKDVLTHKILPNVYLRTHCRLSGPSSQHSLLQEHMYDKSVGMHRSLHPPLSSSHWLPITTNQ